jgi:CDP-diacylglycerol---serine O-phosphatidyltransferase
MKKYIPNTITLGNLFCGCLAIIKIFEGDLVWAAYLVGIALVLDFFDGFTARILKVSSPIGKDLDSLADMVTFGVVPGIMMLKLIEHALTTHIVDGPAKEGWTIYPPEPLTNSYLCYFALIIPIFSCIRLAKFNNDTRQSDSFIGVPTPANAMVICALPLIMEFNHPMYPMQLQNPYVLCLFSLIMSLLLISEIPLFALKFKNFGWADNKLRFVFLALSVVLLFTLQFIAIPLVIILYILLSIVNNIFLKKKV